MFPLSSKLNHNKEIGLRSTLDDISLLPGCVYVNNNIRFLPPNPRARTDTRTPLLSQICTRLSPPFTGPTRQHNKTLGRRIRG